MTPLTISTSNVRTLQDNPSGNRPERRTALIARELDRYNIQILALSETGLANEGQLSEKKSGYISFSMVETATNVLMKVLALQSNQI